MIYCISGSQMRQFLDSIDAEWTAIIDGIIIHATAGDVFWKWFDQTELYCRILV